MTKLLLVALISTASCGTLASHPGQSFEPFQLNELTFVPDAGVRVANATRPAVARAGDRWYIHYVDAGTGQPFYSASPDGLTFVDHGPATAEPPSQDMTGIRLPDGRRRLFEGVSGAIYSFVSRDQSRTFHPERGRRLSAEDFAAPEVHALADPVPVRLPDGRYRLYVVGTAGTVPVILSATTSKPLTDVASPLK